jgi:hypothetical protein
VRRSMVSWRAAASFSINKRLSRRSTFIREDTPEWESRSGCLRADPRVQWQQKTGTDIFERVELETRRRRRPVGG